MFNSSLSKAVNENDSSAQCVDRREMIQVQLSPNTQWCVDVAIIIYNRL